MFTVLLLSPAARAAARRWEPLVAPFVERGDIAVCDWDDGPGDGSLAETVPELAETIRGRRVWQAMVVDVGDGAPTQRPNPFDTALGDGPVALTESVTDPLVRLGHLLLGFPGLPAAGFEPVVSHRGWDPARPPARREGESFQEQVRRLSQTETDVRVLFREVSPDAETVARHARLVERYHPHEERPSELYYVRWRTQDVDTGSLDLRHWTSASDDGMGFVERNAFPPSSRFLVKDMPPASSSLFEVEEMRFWLSALTIAISDLPPSTVQAERLYRIGVDLDREVLAETLSEHLTRMTSVRDHLSSLLEGSRRTPSVEGARLPEPVSTTVEFEAVGGDDLQLALDGYGLAVRTGRSETVRWREDWTRVRTVADGVVRRPRRILARAVEGARRVARAPMSNGGDAGAVDADVFDRDDLEEAVAAGLDPLTRFAQVGVLDRGRWQRGLDAEESRMAIALGERPRLGAVQAIAVLAGVVWVGVSAPWIIRLLVVDVGAGAEAVLAVALVIVAVALSIGIALVVLRARMTALLRQVNARLRHLVQEVVESAQRFSGQLSAIATHMQLQSLLTAGEAAREAARSRRRSWIALRARLDRAIADEKRIASSLGLAWTVRKTLEGLAEFDDRDAAGRERVFRLAAGERSAAFSDSGDRVRAPYDFVTRLHVDRLRDTVPPTSAVTER